VLETSVSDGGSSSRGVGRVDSELGVGRGEEECLRGRWDLTNFLSSLRNETRDRETTRSVSPISNQSFHPV